MFHSFAKEIPLGYPRITLRLANTTRRFSSSGFPSTSSPFPYTMDPVTGIGLVSSILDLLGALQNIVELYERYSTAGQVYGLNIESIKRIINVSHRNQYPSISLPQPGSRNAPCYIYANIYRR